MQDNYIIRNIKIYWYIYLGVLLHFISSYFTVGYFNSDEHYQVIGPLESLLGIDTKLTWEFDSRIRPWIQPYFYFSIVKFFNLIQLQNPFILAFILRLISSLIGFASIVLLYNHLKYKLNIDNNFSKLLIFSFWFFSFLHARTSSENLSISMLIFGIVFFEKIFILESKFKKYFYSFLSGIFYGLTMVIKYHLVSVIFFIYLWFFFNKLKIKNIKYIVINGFFIFFVLFLGLCFDFYGYMPTNERFGYSPYSNTYYNYYHANFVANWFVSFGKDPWWYYIKLIIEKFFPPINIILIFSTIYFWIKGYKNILTYATLPVLIFLSYLSHKEIRFIFPVLIFTPFFLCYFISNSQEFFVIFYI